MSSAALVFRGSDGTSFLSNNRFLGTAIKAASYVQSFLGFPEGFSIWELTGSLAKLQDTAGFCFENGFVYAYTSDDECDDPVTLVPTSKSYSHSQERAY